MSWLLHDLQSMRSAVSGLPMTLMNWSMIPHGIPAWLCSAPGTPAPSASQTQPSCPTPGGGRGSYSMSKQH